MDLLPGNVCRPFRARPFSICTILLLPYWGAWFSGCSGRYLPKVSPAYGHRDLIFGICPLNYFDLTDKATIYPNSTRVSKLWSEGKIEVLENTARKRLQVDKLDLVAHVILLELALRNRDIDSVTANMENILARLAKPKPSLSVVAPSLIMIIRLRADRLLNISSDKWNMPIESENEFYRLGNCPMEPYLILLERSGYFESFE